MADLREIETLISNHINAAAERDRLFHLQDWGLASKEDMNATLGPVDAALIALCAAQPSDSEASSRRARYLNGHVPEAIDGSRGLTVAVIAALVGGAHG
ncbi:hypothetical protein C7441_12540 [Pseudaminobacter salicylatoxidans]|uniref:Uncharacterized protein n=1 Tax=Pseudaminobacter salicylatoxidans TaxID=93369 RepID=A0A316BMS5_PSESE|nr:hypothetical protein [Pseudaminobacter salicylatoxidans]PWJ73856.1 hypothetical protein C7441_12540 [Pseudaminobacter salicylatoxidans]